MRIRQIVFAAAELQRSSELIAQVFGLGTPYADPGVAEFGIANAVFSIGDQFIEVISPAGPGLTDTACGRHLQRHGDSGYMLILQTADLDADRARFAALGVRTVWQSDHADIRASHLHPKDIGGAIVSVDQPQPPASWRWGGPDWRVAPGDAGRQCLRGITLRSAQPQALAQRWAQVLGLADPSAQGPGWRLGLGDGFADFTPADDATRGDSVAGFSLAVADPEAVLARARSCGLAVKGNSLALLGAALELTALQPLQPLQSA